MPEYVVTFNKSARTSLHEAWFRYIVRMASRLFTVGIAALMPGMVHAEDNIQLTMQPSKISYSTGDTVLLAIKAKIGPQYYLYGNPVGPGGGWPLHVSIQQKCSAVRWLEVKKQHAEKIGPPFGDWVWAYRKEAVFFCVGVVVLHNKNGAIVSSGSIRIEGLLCRESCSLQVYTLPFSIDILPRSNTAGHFVNDPGLQTKYRASIPMVDLTSGGR